MSKVTFLVKNIYNQGGDTRSVCILANKLVASENYEITILSLFKTAETPLFALDNRIKIFNLFDEPFSVRKNIINIKKKFKRYVKENLIDFLIIEAIGFNCFTWRVLKKFPNIKTVSVEHASYADGGKVFGLAWFGRRIAGKYNDSIVVLTNRDREDYLQNVRKINRIEQIYNPLDESIANFSYNSNSKKIITCGRLVKVKGYDYLLEVAERVFAKHKEWEWHIYGSGDYQKEMNEIIEAKNLRNNVYLKGEVIDIYSRYKEYSFYVMTSRKESFGMVLIEALQSGIPVISFDCKNGPAEIINQNVNGYLISNFNVEEMVERIEHLIVNTDVRKKFAKNSLLGLDRFEIDNIVGKWTELLESL
ncbi:glycosyl transferase [Rossellomorea marisflavi]|uniref:glycosyltransferase family 4 protein n=1 Tax=Rossellomorea marisflavi TaxID=189381 RepID=UPI0025C778C3|nr:glycosyltransferase family 4 protein [Rossellomorea marisflavi]GLI85285.1 glycosyl transferase [Rossellomorea marisflavi]